MFSKHTHLKYIDGIWWISYKWAFSPFLHCFNELIDWGWTLFSTIFQSYHSGQFTYPCVTPILPRNWLLFQINCLPIGEKRNTFVRLTFVKRRKLCWHSWGLNLQPLDWQPISLQTKLLVIYPMLFQAIQSWVSPCQ